MWLQRGKLRLRVRKEYTWSGSWVQSSETHCIYDGMLVIQERDGNNTPLVSYTRGKDLAPLLGGAGGGFEGAGGIGGLLARTDHTSSSALLKTAFYHADGNGNLTALMSTNGLIVAWYQYDPYGRTLAQSGPLADANVYRFSSKAWQPNSGLYYYGYRFYAPELQRWLNRDPLLDSGPGLPINWQLSSRFRTYPWEAIEGSCAYAFARNAPMTFFDVNGLWVAGIVFDFNVNLFIHAGIHIQFLVGRDPTTGKWSAGVLGGPELGAGVFPNANATANLMVMPTAPSVRCVKGLGAFIGGGGTMPVGASVGGDAIASINTQTGAVYIGGMAGGGFGAGFPADVHGGFSYDSGWDSQGGWEW